MQQSVRPYTPGVWFREHVHKLYSHLSVYMRVRVHMRSCVHAWLCERVVVRGQRSVRVGQCMHESTYKCTCTRLLVRAGVSVSVTAYARGSVLCMSMRCTVKFQKLKVSYDINED